MKHAVGLLHTLAGALAIVALVVLAQGFGGKKEVVPVAVGEMEEYRDPALGFRLKFPKGWVCDAEAGKRAWFYSAQGVKERILDPTGPYPDGAGILVTLTSGQPAETKNAILTELKAANVQVGPEEAATINGVQAVRVSTTANYGSGVYV